MGKSVFHFRFVGHVTSVNRMTKVSVVRDYEKNRYRGLMYESAEYKAFKAELRGALIGAPRLKGYYDLKLKVSLSKRRDTDNPIKPIMDSLEKAGIVENDNRIRNVFIQRAYHKQGLPDIMEIDLYRVRDQDDSWSEEKNIKKKNDFS